MSRIICTIHVMGIVPEVTGEESAEEEWIRVGAFFSSSHEFDVQEWNLSLCRKEGDVSSLREDLSLCLPILYSRKILLMAGC